MMLKPNFLVSIYLIIATTLHAAAIEDLPFKLKEKIAQAAETGRELDNGEFYLDWGGVVHADFDGDRHPDWALNESSFACSTAASLYCGTGGCMSHFLVGEVMSSLFNQGWEMVSVAEKRYLVANVHHSKCGGINPTPCATISIWDSEAQTWRTAAATWE